MARYVDIENCMAFVEGLANLLEMCHLKGNLYSTFRCSYCGGDMVAKDVGGELYFECKNYTDVKSYNEHNGELVHDSFSLTPSEIAAILNFNPLHFNKFNSSHLIPTAEEVTE